jgi:hypothetical protein
MFCKRLVSDRLYTNRFVYKISNNFIHKAICVDSIDHKTSRGQVP